MASFFMACFSQTAVFFVGLAQFRIERRVVNASLPTGSWFSSSAAVDHASPHSTPPFREPQYFYN
jgi:hypothetical protein